MLYGVLADVTVALHLAFVLFVVLGGLLVLRTPRVAWVHIPAAAWGAWIEFAGWICPLTPLENWLRLRGGETGYSGSFVERYVVPALYPDLLSRELQWALGSFVLIVNAGIYLLVYRRWRGARPAKG